MDWHPLADSDPLPGDPDQVEALAAEFDRLGDDIGANNPTLRRVQDQQDWTGEAATAFTGRVGDLPDKLDQVQKRFSSFAGALKAYAPVLRASQATARRALQQAREAQAAASAAQADLNGLTVVRPADAPPEPRARTDARSQAAARCRGQMIAANDDLARSRRMLAEAVGDHREAERKAASSITAAADDDLQNPHKPWWKKAAEAARQVLQVVSKVAGALSAVFGVLALLTCWIPVVGQVFGALALATGVVALVSNTVLMAYGDKSLGDVGMDVLGVIPGGKILRGASLATKGSRVARASRQLSRAARVGRDVEDATRGLRSAHRVDAVTTRLGQGLKKGLEDSVSELTELRSNARVMGVVAVDPPFARQVARHLDGPLTYFRNEFTAARATGPFGAAYRTMSIAADVAQNAVQLPSGVANAQALGSGHPVDPRNPDRWGRVYSAP